MRRATGERLINLALVGFVRGGRNLSQTAYLVCKKLPDLQLNPIHLATKLTASNLLVHLSGLLFLDGFTSSGPK